MREKIQGIYGGGTQVQFSKIPFAHYEMSVQLPCGPAKVDTLIAAFRDELNDIAKNGIDTGYVSKVKKAWIEQYKVDIKKNEYWLSSLQSINRGEKTADRFINAEKYFNAFTANDIKKAANILMNSQGKLMAVQMPEVIKKEEPKKGF
jgi:zinc protease